MDVQAYHGVSGATHQTHVTNLSKAGYGMISLSVYGDPGDAQYAAVWVNRPMPQWSAIHGADGNAYQAWFNTNVNSGYGASLVSATGSGGDAMSSPIDSPPLDHSTGVSTATTLRRCRTRAKSATD